MVVDSVALRRPPAALPEQLREPVYQRGPEADAEQQYERDAVVQAEAAAPGAHRFQGAAVLSLIALTQTAWLGLLGYVAHRFFG
jgi:hypothetical protein